MTAKAFGFARKLRTALLPVAALAIGMGAMPALVTPAQAVMANPPMGGAGGAGGDPSAMMEEIFGKLFDTSNLEPVDPARLELSTVTVGKMMPDGFYGKMMSGVMDSMLKPLLALDPGYTPSKVAMETGISFEEAEALGEDKLKAVEQLLDPQRATRGQAIIDAVMPLVTDALTEVEPLMREGMAKAYARKFSAQQLTDMNAFFATPSGSAFAAESFAIQADPEIMSATFKAFPVILRKVMADGPKIEERMKAIPEQRKIDDLSDTELVQLATLVGSTPEALRAHAAASAPAMEAVEDAAADEDAAAAEGAAAAAAAAAAAVADAAGDADPWYLRENWTEADRARVEKLEAEADAAFNASMQAEQDAIEATRARLETKKKK